MKKKSLAGALILGLVMAPAAPARPLDKLDGQLRDLAAGKRPYAKQATGPLRPVAPEVTSSGKVLVDVYVRGAMRPAADALRDEGMRVKAISGRSPGRIVEGWIQVDALEEAAALRSVKAIVPVPPAVLDVGSAESEGVAQHNVPPVHAAGHTGAGVPIGVISDTMNKVGGGIATSVGTGDLPADTQVLSEPASGTDEGRAMAEIIYDMAPGVPRFRFSGGNAGPATKAASIDNLSAGGAKVIADDITYLSEPVFQDGIVAQAADRAKANGTAYFVSAGNRGRQGWEGVFRPSSVPSQNDFDPGAGEDRRQTIATVPNGATVTLALHWDDPAGASQSDFAIDVYPVAGEANAPAISTTSDNLATGQPVELVQFAANGGSAEVSIGIRRVAGGGNNPTPRFKWMYHGNSTTPVPSEHSTNSGTISPDAASARGALAVAAVDQGDPGLDDAEPYSSRGPSITRFFDKEGNRLAAPDVRPKPDLAAADAVATTVPGFTEFRGTSAAAPSAAGVGALLLSARPSLSVDQLYAIMRDPRGANDCVAPGLPDADCGSGFVFANGKLAMALDPSAPVVKAAVTPGTPAGANGWHRGNVGVTWNVSEPDSPLTAQSGCGPQSVTRDGVSSFTCTAVSPGGTSKPTVTVKRDATPPAVPELTGIADGAAFALGAVPPQSAFECGSSDATSGIASCAVTGYGNGPGAHTLTALATDQAGLTSTRTLTYTVIEPSVAAQLPVGAAGLKAKSKQTLRSVMKSGFVVTINVAADDTATDSTLKLGRTTVGRLRKTFDKGRATVKIKLTKAGKKKLRGKRKAKLALIVKVSGPNVTPTSLEVSPTLKR